MQDFFKILAQGLKKNYLLCWATLPQHFTIIKEAQKKLVFVNS